jgi:cytochrome c biogenesis protein CcmG/thiol:disulfide interchange protein DsbE
MQKKQPTVLRRFMPLIVFAGLVIFLAIGLTLNPRIVPSPLIGKPAPEFELPLLSSEGTFSNKDLIGHVTLVNVWASWCFACRQEHEAVKYLGRNGVRIVGLNYKDEPDNAKAWLAKLGNPYEVVAADYDGRVGIDWGVYGAPETFLIDPNGIIRHKVIGPIMDIDQLDIIIEIAEKEHFDDLLKAVKSLKDQLEKII